MKEFNEKSYWSNRYENDRHMFLGDGSGAGSSGEEAVSKAICINYWIKEYGMRTITEFGCGTGENLKLYDIPISYNGYDFSEKAIEICKEKFTQNPELLVALKATGFAYLEEGNTWGDRVWGVSPPSSGAGGNWLGLVLMVLRSTL